MAGTPTSRSRHLAAELALNRHRTRGYERLRARPSVPICSFTTMTTKRSEFGSLEDRTRRTRAGRTTAGVRHIWLDRTCPGLLMDRRKTVTGDWEGLVIRIEDHQLIIDWVPDERISITSPDDLSAPTQA